MDNILYSVDPVIWVKEQIGIEPDQWQADLLLDNHSDIIVNASRQVGKSSTIALKSLHKAIYRKNSLILIISPSERQSKELLLKVKQGINSLEIKPGLKEDNKLSIILDNDSRIVALPGSESTVRGFSSVNLLIIDEASRIDEELYYATKPMLAISKGNIILLSTPNGKQGLFYEIWENSDTFKKYRIKATDCSRISEKFLEEQRKELGELMFKQEYMTEFIDNCNQLFSSDLIEKAFVEDLEPFDIDLSS